jgi:hypothetical protein
MGESSRRHKSHGYDPKSPIFFWRVLRWTGVNAYGGCEGFHAIRPTINTDPNAVGPSVCPTNRSPDDTASDSYTDTHTDPNKNLYAHSDKNTDENTDKNTDENIDQNTDENT